MKALYFNIWKLFKIKTAKINKKNVKIMPAFVLNVTQIESIWNQKA